MKLNEKMLNQMVAATRRLIQHGPSAATKAIQKALRARPGQPDLPAHEPGVAAPAIPPALADMLATFRVPNALGPAAFEMAPFDLSGTDTAPGLFIDGSYTNAAGTRAYKLYVPAGYQGQAMPLVVMLHGCTQSPDDFARGTQMNALAEEKQCLVLYPAQSRQANHSFCWNWFSAIDQQRDQGEPSIIAGMTREMAERYEVEDGQVFIAGLSAGGAMAVIMGTLYPELYAAVGVHSGLPYACAHDLPSALAAMKGHAKHSERRFAERPLIVFHGDRDATVHPSNGEELIAQGVPHGARSIHVEPGSKPDGHAYTRTVLRRADGAPLAEHWVIHGAGHAWSGGSARGTYTDSKGPDASREMLRFFSSRR